MPNLRPSKLKQTRICPGSTAYLDFIGHKSESSVYAVEGTAAHALLEKVLSGKKSAGTFLGRHIKVLPSGGTSFLKKTAIPDPDDQTIFCIDQEMVDSVNMAVNYVDSRLPDGDRSLLKLEQRISCFSHQDFSISGTADVIIDRWPYEIEIVDFKYGRGVLVPARGNEQLMAYALGALDNGDYEQVRYTIIQPRNADGGISSEMKSVEQLTREFIPILSGTIESYINSRDMLKKGGTLDDLFRADLLSVGKDGSHCTFCELKAKCPALLVRALELTDGVLPQFPAVPSDLKQLLKIYGYSDTFKKWLAAIEDELIRRALAGENIPGKKLVKSYGHRAWKDKGTAESLAEKLQDLFNLPAKKFLETKVISPAKVERLITPSQREEIKSLTTRPELPPKLVDADAKGEQFDPLLENSRTNAAEDFLDDL